MLLWELIVYQPLMTAISSHTLIVSSRKFCAGVQQRLLVCCIHVAYLLLCSLTIFLAGPHRLIRDDEHDGYFIPEGTVVIVNVW